MKLRSFFVASLPGVLLMMNSIISYANIKLPAIISNGMILQQQSKVTLWGWADPGELVNVKADWQQKNSNARADRSGNWSIQLNTPRASQKAYHILFVGKNELRIDSVLIGEVWLCSGQSNMQFTFAKGPLRWETGVFDYELKAAKINDPFIREFAVKQVIADTPAKDAAGKWSGANPVNVRMFSATGYYFARALFEKTGYPVGIINATWGSTPAESWTAKATLLSDRTLAAIVKRYEKAVNTYPADSLQFEQTMRQWRTDTASAKVSNRKRPALPVGPISPKNPQSPYKIYNAMIAPLRYYKLKGVIWYQGESNTRRAFEYRKLFPALINNWRLDHNAPDLPFYFVQISTHPSQTPEIREAQFFASKTIKNSGMVVSADVGDSLTIHPRNKAVIGERLSLWALAQQYGFSSLAFSGPLYRGYQVIDDSVKIFFNYSNHGLIAKDELLDFQIAGADRQFYPAQARISGNTILVYRKQVRHPIAVRFGWKACPVINLYNTDGLPASPFRTDNWPDENYRGEGPGR